MSLTKEQENKLKHLLPFEVGKKYIYTKPRNKCVEYLVVLEATPDYVTMAHFTDEVCFKLVYSGYEKGFRYPYELIIDDAINIAPYNTLLKIICPKQDLDL